MKESFGRLMIDIEGAALSSYDIELIENPHVGGCLLYTSPSPRDGLLSRMPSSA